MSHLPSLVEQLTALGQNAPAPASADKFCPPQHGNEVRRNASMNSIRAVLAGKGWRSTADLAVSLGRERSNVGTTIRRIMANIPNFIEQGEKPGTANSPWGHRTVHIYRWIGD